MSDQLTLFDDEPGQVVERELDCPVSHWISEDHKMRDLEQIEKAKRESPVPLKACVCGKPGFMRVDGFRPGNVIVECEGDYKSRWNPCSTYRQTASCGDKVRAAEMWNSDQFL
jgi:hypothetical protein